MPYDDEDTRDDNYTEFIDPKEEYMNTLIVEEGMERRKARRKAERWEKKNQERNRRVR